MRRHQRHRTIAAALFLIAVATTCGSIAHAQPAVAEPPKAEAKPAEAKSAEKPVDIGALFRMHWTNRVNGFRMQNEPFQNVVLLGDSITEGFDVGKYFPGRRVLNRGIGADVIGNDLPETDNRGVLKRLNESVYDCSATDVFLLIGVNDFGSGRTPEVMEEGYRDILAQIKKEAPRVRVHVQSVLPTRDKYAKHNANIVDFNGRIKKLAEANGCDYIDLHALMIDDKAELKAEYTNDGLHLNEAAYRVWLGEVERVMKWND